MSVQAITWAFQQEGMTSGQKFILVSLCNRADEDWSCYPSIPLISAETGIGERSVREHLDALEKLGVISRARTRNSDGTLGRYRFFVQRQYVGVKRTKRRKSPVDSQRRNPPVAKFAAGQKTEQKQEPAKFAAGKNEPQPAANFAGHNRQVETKVSYLSPELGDAFEGLWSIWPAKGRERSKAKAKVREVFAAACRNHPPEAIIGSAKRWLSGKDPQFVPALDRWLKDGRYEHNLPSGNVVSLPVAGAEKWANRAELWRTIRSWNVAEWGPAPGSPGCQCPPEFLRQGREAGA